MACLDMYNQNNEHNKHLGCAPPIISPRISFSNDFVLESSPHSSSSSSSSSTSHQHFRSYRDAPVSSDFEFSVSSYSMMSADELFSQGKLLPLKENCRTNQFQRTTTLRDELMNEDDDANFSLRPPKSSTRWKGFLGLKKSHIGSRKIDRGEGSSSFSSSSSDLKRSSFLHEDVHTGKPSQIQDMLNDCGSSSNSNQDQFRF